MSIAQNISKFAAAAAGASLVAMSLAPAAFAQTTGTTTGMTTTTSTSMSSAQVAALQAQIASLQAQLSASQGSSMMMSTTFTRDLTIGSTGSDVTALQNWLISKGYSIPAGATGYFGTQTRTAVAAWQRAAGITPAAGYFGPISRAQANMGGSTTTTTTTTGGTTTTTTTGSLSGGEGSINNFQVLGAPSNATLYQGQMQQVYGFQFNAVGSDLQVNRVDYDVVNTGQNVNGATSHGQTRPWNVLQTATLYDGSTVVGTVDASNANNWSEDGNVVATSGNGGATYQQYRLRFDGLKDIVKMGSTANYYLSFTTQNGVSTQNQSQYMVMLSSQGVRATDAMGLQQYSPTFSSAAGNSQNFTVSNGTAGTVTISTGSDNPQATTVMANQTSMTNDVVLATFSVQSNGSAVMIYSLPVTVTATASTSNFTGFPVNDLKLYQGSTLLDTESIGTGNSYTTTGNGLASTTSTGVTFDNLNIQIPQGSTGTNFSIRADVSAVGGSNASNAVEGTSVSVQVLGTGADFEQGSNRVDVSSQSVTGNAITLRTQGLSPDATPTLSANATSVGNSTQQTGNFTFTFNVTAFGHDVYVGQSNAFTATIHNSSAATTSAATGALTVNGATITTNGNYLISSGQTKQVTVTTSRIGGGGQYYYATLDSLNYGLSDSNAHTATTTLNTSYRTPAILIQG